MASHRPIPGPGSGSGSSSSSGVFPLNFPFGDTTYTKVFVGGLAWETKNEALRRHFEQYGEILEAVVITDKSTGRSKGYGFVTFRHPDSARRACVDPSPVIDGRRANCNLASRGRPWATPPHVRMRPASPFFGGASVPRGAYVGSPAYPQTFPYYYQQGFPYPSYGYTPYGLEFAYPQNARNPYPPQQYVFQGVPGTVDPAVYSFGQFGQPLPGVHGLQGYSIPGNQNLIQFSRPNISGVAPVSVPVQASYPPGLITAQPQFMVPVPPQLSQGSGSHQTTS